MTGKERTGNARGRPAATKMPNAHAEPCYICGNEESISWKALEPDDGAPLMAFRRWRWYCSGTASGGTKQCSNAGARLMDLNEDPRTRAPRATSVFRHDHRVPPSSYA